MRITARAAGLAGLAICAASGCSDASGPQPVEATFAAGVYELAAPIASWDPGWGIDLAGHHYRAVLTFIETNEGGQVGTFAEFELFNPAGEALDPPRNGVVIRRPGVGESIVLELVDLHFTFTLIVSDITADGERLAGTFGMGGHISGPFTANRAEAQPNTAPVVRVGYYIVALPASEVLLSGQVDDAEGNVVSYSWRRVAGPAEPVIESPNALATSVTGLEAGRYGFELVARDRGGLIGRDTAVVFVYSRGGEGENELILTALPWRCPMGCTLLMPDVSDFLAGSVETRVFLMPSDLMEWVEAIPDTEAGSIDDYFWGFDEYGFWVYTHDAAGWADLKIVTRRSEE